MGTIGTSCSSPFATNTASLTGVAAVSAYFSDSANAATVSGSTVGTAANDMFFLEETGTTGTIATSGGAGIAGTGSQPAGQVVLVSDNGSIGTSSTAVDVNAAQLTMQAKASGQNVYVTDITPGNVTLSPCTSCGTGSYDNNAGSTYNLTANSAPSVLTATGETVTAGSVSVTDTGGTIGTSCTSPFATSTASLTGVAAVSAYFSDSANTVTISGSTVGTATSDMFFLEETGTTGTIATSGTAGIAGTGSVAAGQVVLVSDNGSIGTSSAAANVDAAQLTMQAKASGQNVYVNDLTTGNVTLAPCSGCGTGSYDNNANGTYNLTANSAPSVLTATGEIVTAGTINVSATSGTIGTSCTSPFASSTANLTATAANSAYFSDSANTVTISGSTVGIATSDMFFLEETGTTGTIATSGTAGIAGTGSGAAGQVVLVSDNGSIGTSSAAVNVNAAQLTMQSKASSQNVYVNDITTGNVTLAPCSGCGTGNYDNNANGIYNLTANNAPSVLTATGETVTAGTLNVSATSGTIGTSCTSPFTSNTANLTATAANSAYFSDSANTVNISGSTVGTAAADVFFLGETSATGNIATSGDAGIAGTGSGAAGQVVLVSDNGSIGTSSAAVNVNAAQLTMQAKASGQNVYVNDITTGNVTLASCSGCGAGNYHNNANGTFNLTANSAPSVLTATGETVTASSVSVTDTTGTIGTSCTSPFATNTANLTGVAAVSAYFSDSASAVTVSGSAVGTATTDMFFLEETGTTGILPPAETQALQVPDPEQQGRSCWLAITDQ